MYRQICAFYQEDLNAPTMCVAQNESQWREIAKRFQFAVLLLCFLGCTTREDMSSPPTSETIFTNVVSTATNQVGSTTPYGPPYVIIPIFYATDRTPVRSLESWRTERRRTDSELEYYGKEWSTKMELGLCKVSIPVKVHEPGKIERPRSHQTESVEKHLVILTIEPESSTNFLLKLKNRIEKSDERDAFIFIHGYNVTFAEAVLRTAQIAYDVGFEGAPILYSWPSAGDAKLYLRDEESIQLTASHLRVFLNDIINHSSVRKLHLVAHSMGNRALTDVLRHFARREGGPLFNEIILAAPDVNRTLFLSEILPGILGTSKRMTLYASSDDLPLKASRRFHDYVRAGEGTPNLTVANGFETIDATGIDTDMMAHSYFSTAKAVVEDIATILCKGHGTGLRALDENDLNGIKYWRLRGAPRKKEQ